ncbi:MAG: hypothetical protein ACRDIU_11300 [Actinomycetota bacterium]
MRRKARLLVFTAATLAIAVGSAAWACTVAISGVITVTPAAPVGPGAAQNHMQVSSFVRVVGKHLAGPGTYYMEYMGPVGTNPDDPGPVSSIVDHNDDGIVNNADDFWPTDATMPCMHATPAYTPGSADNPGQTVTRAGNGAAEQLVNAALDPSLGFDFVAKLPSTMGLYCACATIDGRSVTTLPTPVVDQPL